MPKAREHTRSLERSLAKAPTGIPGLDEITSGGVPKGRPTLVCGGPGCGKTMLAMEFLVHGALQYNEPGVFMVFEETAEDLTHNFASLEFDLRELSARNKILLEYVYLERSEITETGEYDLEGLFVRLGHAIAAIGAKRVVLDTLEALFAGLPNEAVLRAELRRLFRWLKTQGVTALITGERGERALTRYGFEEYVADCVILLDHRVADQISTRHLRIVKYRGSAHGTGEYPFLIGQHGISVLPVSSLALDHHAPTERVSTGVARLDTMLGGRGFFRGSSILVSGGPGTGKTSLTSHCVDAACRRGERCLYVAFEESPHQIMRNMRSINIDLAAWVKKGLLQFHAVRPTSSGLEMHLVSLQELVKTVRPRIAIVDPISNLAPIGNFTGIRFMLTRLVDFFKVHQITSLYTDLLSGVSGLEQTSVGISSLMDTWLLLGNAEGGGERNRTLQVLKARGTAHSNQVQEFVLTDTGITLRDVYVGPGGVLTGAARAVQEAQEKAAAVARQQEVARKQRDLERKRAVLDAQVMALRAAFAAEEEETHAFLAHEQLQEKILGGNRVEMARLRHANLAPSNGPPKGKGQGH